MYNLKKITPVVINKMEQDNKVSYRVEQNFMIEGYEFTFKHSCIVQNDGSVSVTDYDQKDFTPLNADIEQQLIEKFNTSDAFEIYELMSIEATEEALKAI